MADSHTRLTMNGSPPGHTRDEAVARRPHPLVSIAHTDLPLWAKVIKNAGCADSGLDPEQWFPLSLEANKARREAAAAITVCSACPVRARCLELSLRHWDIGQHGVWGGLVAADRAHLRHKRHPSIVRQPVWVSSPQIPMGQRGGQQAEDLRDGLIPVPHRGAT
jgi:WhiB family transcriptional regulator, redox-sensing transcriptional regulator